MVLHRTVLFIKMPFLELGARQRHGCDSERDQLSHRLLGLYRCPLLLLLLLLLPIPLLRLLLLLLFLLLLLLLRERNGLCLGGGSGDVAVVVVGGGASLCDSQLAGASRVLIPKHADIANAVGAALPQARISLPSFFIHLSDRLEILAKTCTERFK